MTISRPLSARRPAGRVLLLVLALVVPLLGLLPTAAQAATQGTAVVLRSTDGGFSYQPWTLSPDGSGLRRVTSQSAITQPALSPDGARLAFAGPVGNDDSLGRYAIFTVALDGSGLRQLTSPRFGDLDPAWSADGRYLLFTRNINGRLTRDCCTIYEIAADGSQLHAIPNTPSGREPSFSPDGGSLVYVAPGGLFVISINGSNRRQLAAGSFTDPVYSPDGRYIAVTLDRSPSRSDLGLVNVGSGGVAIAATSGARIESPQWDGPQTLRYVEMSGYGYGGRTNATLRQVAASGGTKTTTADPPGEFVELAFSPSESPFGSLDSFARGPGTVRVAGWAIDPDTTEPIDVAVTVDTRTVAQVSAAGSRPDVARVYPAYGPAHGFSTTVQVPSGNHRVCVIARNVPQGVNSDTTLGCRNVSGTPFGRVDTLVRRPGGASVSGWAIDPDTTAPARVVVSVDGKDATTATANGARPDVGRVYRGYGDAHGFNVPVSLSDNVTHQVCVRALDDASGAPVALPSCLSIRPSDRPFANLDSAVPAPGGFRLRGWAIDPDTADPVTLHAYVDGRAVKALTASGLRPDVGRVYAGYGDRHGFDAVVPVPGGRHQVCLYGINPNGTNPLLTCRTVERGVDPIGVLDVARREGGGIAVAGWALDPDTAASLRVDFYVDGAGRLSSSADGSRPDVAAAFPGWGPAHGFAVTVPGGGSRVCAYAIDQGAGSNRSIGCRSV